MPRALLALSLVGCLLGSAAAPATAASRTWTAPLAGPLVVRRAFDPPDQPWLAGHRGVDLAARPGQAVRAAGGGVVRYAGDLAGRGVVSISHGELRTTYEPLEVLVTEGERVARGQLIGHVAAGHAGPSRPGEALLHWGLRRGRTYLDPMLLLRQGPVRLLPVWGVEGRPAVLRAAAEPVPPQPRREPVPVAHESALPGATLALASLVGCLLVLLGTSRAARRAWPAAAAPLWCASDRSGSP